MCSLVIVIVSVFPLVTSTVKITWYKEKCGSNETNTRDSAVLVLANGFLHITHQNIAKN